MTWMTDWTEEQALAYFWLMARDLETDRLDLLRQLSRVRIARPSDWDRKEIRRQVEMLRPRWNHFDPRGSRITLDNDQCWACFSREYRCYLHHVITVENGGSSQPWNLVSICHRHHQAVHPWLRDGDTTEKRDGFVLLRDYITRGAFQRLERVLTQDPEKVNR
jgi:hypothetical protein